MFIEPTEPDVVNLIQFRVKPIVDQFKIDAGKWRVECASRGLSNSTVVDQKLLELGLRAARSACQDALKCCEQLKQHGAIGPTQATNSARASFEAIKDQITDVLGKGSAPRAGQQSAARVSNEVEDIWSLHVVGLSNFLNGSDTPTQSNMISIENSTGIAIQQASPHAHISDTPNTAAVLAAAERLATQLSLSSIPQSQLVEMVADLETIKAQLKKQRPSQPVLREAAMSLRNIAEGIAGGMLTTPVSHSLRELLRILGIA